MFYIENPPYQYGHLYRTFYLLQFLLLEVQFSILDDLQQTSVVDDRHVAPAPTLLRQQLLEDLGTDSIYNKPYTIRSLKASKPWGWGLAVSDSYEISQVSQQNCCRGAVLSHHYGYIIDTVAKRLLRGWCPWSSLRNRCKYIKRIHKGLFI